MFLLLLAIAPAKTRAAAAQGPASPPAVWIDVPYVHQPVEGCGAASIAMVMNYWAVQRGTKISAADDVEAIKRELTSPRGRGISTEQMEAYLRAHGFQVFTINGSWGDLDAQLRKGRPLIVAIRPGGQRELHYVVVDGIDAERGTITMNDPAERKLLTRERAGFEREWSATRNWMLLAVPAQAPR